MTAHGERVPYSLLNIADPSLEGNYSELGIPHRNPRVERLQIAHLLAVASKLAYEHPKVIEDVVMFRWGSSAEGDSIKWGAYCSMSCLCVRQSRMQFDSDFVLLQGMECLALGSLTS